MHSSAACFSAIGNAGCLRSHAAGVDIIGSSNAIGTPTYLSIAGMMALGLFATIALSHHSCYILRGPKFWSQGFTAAGCGFGYGLTNLSGIFLLSDLTEKNGGAVERLHHNGAH